MRKLFGTPRKPGVTLGDVNKWSKMLRDSERFFNDAACNLQMVALQLEEAEDRLSDKLEDLHSANGRKLSKEKKFKAVESLENKIAALELLENEVDEMYADAEELDFVHISMARIKQAFSKQKARKK